MNATRNFSATMRRSTPTPLASPNDVPDLLNHRATCDFFSGTTRLSDFDPFAMYEHVSGSSETAPDFTYGVGSIADAQMLRNGMCAASAAPVCGARAVAVSKCNVPFQDSDGDGMWEFVRVGPLAARADGDVWHALRFRLERAARGRWLTGGALWGVGADGTPLGYPPLRLHHVYLTDPDRLFWMLQRELLGVTSDVLCADARGVHCALKRTPHGTGFYVEPLQAVHPNASHLMVDALVVDVGRAGEASARPAHAARTYLEVALRWIDTPSASAAARSVGRSRELTRLHHVWFMPQPAIDNKHEKLSWRLSGNMPRFGVYLLPPGQPSLRWMGGTMLSSGRLRGTFLHSHPTHLEVAWVVAASPAEIGLETAEFQRAGIAAMPLAAAGAPESGAAELAAARARLKLLVVRTGRLLCEFTPSREEIGGIRYDRRAKLPAAHAAPDSPCQSTAFRAGSHLTLISLARAPPPRSCDGDPPLFAEANYMHTSFIMWLSLDDPTVSHWKKLVYRAHVNPPTQQALEHLPHHHPHPDDDDDDGAAACAQRRRANPHHHPHPETAEPGIASATIGVGDPGAVLTASCLNFMHSAEGNDAAWPLTTSDGGMYATWSPHQDPCFYDRFRLLRREFGDEGQSISDALGRLAVAPLTAAYQAGRPISVLSIGAGDGTVDEPLYRTLAAVSGGRPLVYHAAEPVGYAADRLRQRLEAARAALGRPSDEIRVVSMPWGPDVADALARADGDKAPATQRGRRRPESPVGYELVMSVHSMYDMKGGFWSTGKDGRSSYLSGFWPHDGKSAALEIVRRYVAPGGSVVFIASDAASKMTACASLSASCALGGYECEAIAANGTVSLHKCPSALAARASREHSRRCAAAGVGTILRSSRFLDCDALKHAAQRFLAAPRRGGAAEAEATSDLAVKCGVVVGPGASIEHSLDTGLARLLKEFAPRGFTSEACAVRVQYRGAGDPASSKWDIPKGK